jgi:hypothetical protein
LSLGSEYTPSALAEELVIRANKVRGITGLDIAPMIVVEGAGDETALSPVCCHGRDQVFVAGGRALVEQLLGHLKREPIEGCECVFLIDCDGQGKTAYLLGEDSLLVTETCDLEADLVHTGVAARLAARFLPDQAAVDSTLTRSCELALAISIVRRAAHAVSAPMHHDNGRQFRLADLPEADYEGWLDQTPDPGDVLATIAAHMGFSSQQVARVSARLVDVPADFAETCMGKDALDVLFQRLRREGAGEVRGWDCHHFHRRVFAELTLTDIAEWEVGRRLSAWEQSTGLEIVRRPA